MKDFYWIYFRIIGVAQYCQFHRSKNQLTLPLIFKLDMISSTIYLDNESKSFNRPIFPNGTGQYQMHRQLLVCVLKNNYSGKSPRKPFVKVISEKLYKMFQSKCSSCNLAFPLATMIFIQCGFPVAIKKFFYGLKQKDNLTFSI